MAGGIGISEMQRQCGGDQGLDQVQNMYSQQGLYCPKGEENCCLAGEINLSCYNVL